MKKEVSGYRLVFGYLGIFIAFEGLVTLLPLFMCFYPGEAVCWLDFFIPGVSAILVGVTLWLCLIAGHEKAHFGKNDDSLLLVLLWLCAFVIGSLPFSLANVPALNGGVGRFGLSYMECLFESVSGYSATGLTVFTSFLDSPVQYCSHVFLFYRALTEFVGGIGLVLIVAGAISDRYNLKLYFAEGHNDKLMPNLGRSAKLIFGIYFGYVLLGSISLWIAGMDFFDAACHSMAALATGGFSPRSTSLLFYQALNGSMINGWTSVNSMALEIIMMILMLLGATNFVLHTFLFRGRWKAFFKDIEIRLALILIVSFTLITTVSSLYLYHYGNVAELDFPTSLRYSVFNIVSSLTTTGFGNAPSVGALGEVAMFAGILMMTIGGGVGSTAGGIKQYRVGLLLKDFVHSIRYRFSSSRALNPNPVYRLGERKEEDPATSDEAHNYALLYILVFLAGSMLVAFMPQIGLTESLYEFVSALSGTGLDAVGLTGYKVLEPTAYPWLLLILDAGMFLGRLEILPIHFALERVTVDSIENVRKGRKKALKEA